MCIVIPESSGECSNFATFVAVVVLILSRLALPPPTPREYFAQEEFVRMYREETGRPIVEIAHMEIAEPSIEVAFGRCVEQGATLVAVSPFFLSPGRHWQEVRATVSPGVIFSFYFV